jgi:hypothetical protein
MALYGWTAALPSAATIWRWPCRVTGGRIEQRLRLRAEPLLSEAAVLVRGGPDTQDKLARHARRTARAWSLDGQPLLGIRSSPSWTSRSMSC